ncbi:hypothetical protein M758_3G125200 [Ceratodon purpureus]|nr:hypothetical protein M758_3G125200 [Ceratodon purpureus]
MAVVVGSTASCYYGYGSLVSSRVRRNSLMPANFAPSLRRYSRRGNSSTSSGPFRVAATMNLDSMSELYDIASQIPNSLYSLSEDITDGPIELPPELLDPLAIPEASPLQVAASVVLTGLITVLLFRSIRRRSRRAKEMKFRSTGAAKLDIKEDARKSAMALLNKTPEIETPPPSALQTLSGAAVAGAIALVLYKFTTTVEGGFSGKAVSMNYSIRNLTITVRTIITGMCYLATFVFAANSIGLTLLSLQLALNLGGSDESKPKPSDANPDLEKPSEDDSS